MAKAAPLFDQKTRANGRVLTLRMLQKRQACESQLQIFREIFINQHVSVTPEVCLQHAPYFNWEWAGFFLLSGTARVEFENQKHNATVERIKGKITEQQVRQKLAVVFGNLFMHDDMDLLA